MLTKCVKTYVQVKKKIHKTKVQSCGVDAEQLIKSIPRGEDGRRCEEKCKFLIVIWNKPLPPSWSIPDDSNIWAAISSDVWFTSLFNGKAFLCVARKQAKSDNPFLKQTHVH